MSWGSRERALCSWKLTTLARAVIPWCESSPAVRRVSSAAIASASRSIRRARNVMSSRLPIGVATTKSVPGIWTLGGEDELDAQVGVARIVPRTRGLLYHWWDERSSSVGIERQP